MRKSTQIVIGFALAGLLLPFPLLLFRTNAMLAICLCPPSIVAFAFAIDGPPWLAQGGVLLLLMCVANAILYAVAAFLIGIVYRIFQPSRTTDVT
jgi:hypothetical protein